MRQALAFAAVAALATAWIGVDAALAQIAMVATWAIAGLGLVLIVGHAGQVSLGHGATLALGAYATALLAARGVPLPLVLAAAMLAGAALGALASLPGRRLGGLAFAMSTLALALVVEEVLVRLEGVTGGAAGLIVPAGSLLGVSLGSPPIQALVGVSALLLALGGCRRLLASRLGRGWRALRDDEHAAAAVGIDAAPLRTAVFALGGALGGLAGALYALWLGFLSPEQFGLQLSFELLMLVFVGGVRAPLGAVWGAVVIVTLPQFIAAARAQLPMLAGGAAGLEMMLFGLLLVLIVVFRPGGLHGGAR